MHFEIVEDHIAALRHSTIDYHNSLSSVVEMRSMVMMVAVVGVSVTIFFPRVILYINSYFGSFMVVWGFGVGDFC